MTDYSVTIPTIETERLILRGWKEADVDPYFEMYGDEHNARFVGGHFTRRDQAWRRVAEYVGQWQMRGYAMFAVEEKASGEFVDCCGPHFPDGWPEPEIGWGLRISFQGKGYATEAAMASLIYAYTELGLTTAMSLIDPLNTSSAMVAMRLGAKYETNKEVTGFTADVYRHRPSADVLAGA
ncbi:MAG: GNAT family N-acetyltransferase [Pseudomonadota bacterium]